MGGVGKPYPFSHATIRSEPMKVYMVSFTSDDEPIGLYQTLEIATLVGHSYAHTTRIVEFEVLINCNARMWDNVD